MAERQPGRRRDVGENTVGRVFLKDADAAV
jgi:hypothetical protein